MLRPRQGLAEKLKNKRKNLYILDFNYFLSLSLASPRKMIP